MTDREKELIAEIEKDVHGLDGRLIRLEAEFSSTPCEEHKMEIRNLQREVADMRKNWMMLIAALVFVLSIAGTALGSWLAR